MKELKQLFKRIIPRHEEEGLIEIYKRLRPGEPPTVESAKSLVGCIVL